MASPPIPRPRNQELPSPSPTVCEELSPGLAGTLSFQGLKGKEVEGEQAVGP